MAHQVPTLIDKTIGTAHEKLGERLVHEKPLLGVLPWRQANKGDAEEYSDRASLPGTSLGAINQGTFATASTYQLFLEATSEVEALAVVDAKLVHRRPKDQRADFRAREESGHVEAIGQGMVANLLYGNRKQDGRAANGLLTRASSLTDPTFGERIVLGDPAASGADQASIILLGLSEDTVYGVYPEGTVAGLAKDDRGLHDDTLSDGSIIRRYHTFYSFTGAPVVKDPRYVAVIRNIDTSTLTGDPATSGTNLVEAFQFADNLIHSHSGVRLVALMPRYIAPYFEMQFQAMSNPVRASELYKNGPEIPMVRGYHLLVEDGMSITEAPIV